MTNQYMQEEDDAILKTYNRYPVVLDHGDGAYLYDPEGKKYLDFSAGYAYLLWDITTRNLMMH